MHFSQSDAVAIAQADLEHHLAQQSEAVAPESLLKQSKTGRLRKDNSA